MQFIGSAQRNLSLVPGSEVMITNAVACGPDDSLDAARIIKKQRCVREIPVLDGDGTLRGIVSIGDINAVLLTEDTIEGTFIHEFIHGGVR